MICVVSVLCIAAKVFLQATFLRKGGGRKSSVTPLYLLTYIDELTPINVPKLQCIIDSKHHPIVNELEYSNHESYSSSMGSRK